MIRSRVTLLTVLGIAVATAGQAAAANNSQESPTVLKTRDGLHFQLPPDWPVEKRGNVVAPIPVEEYLTRKFSALENRLRALEQQVGAMDLRVRVLEEEIKSSQRLKSGGEPAP